MKTPSTALTRPRSAFGVASAATVERMFIVNMSTIAAHGERERTTAGTSARGRRRPCRRRTRRRRAAACGPRVRRIGVRVSWIPAINAPTAVALRSTPSPNGPVWRIERAKSGSSATDAAEEHGEQVERDRAEDDLGVADEADPEEHAAQAGCRVVCTRRRDPPSGASPQPPGTTVRTERSLRRTRPPSSRAKSRPPSAGPLTPAICDATERRARALARYLVRHELRGERPCRPASPRRRDPGAAPRARGTARAAAPRRWRRRAAALSRSRSRRTTPR